ncbi:MAG: formylmethanofuran--tetrahydromethanopterin N-formyltransferase [Synergistales bacterium]|nr:formylmethanofuran--tetrahydromethanopterin N-formyltransferase [Synergistales bacterium]
MLINGVEVVDTFAEAFGMWGTRFCITAADDHWLQAAAGSVAGFATSVIGCGCEAGVERWRSPEETPDGRPGVDVLLFVPSKKNMEKQLIGRVGQAVMTCPTTACYAALEGERSVAVGARLRYFGDTFQVSKLLEGRRYWRIPVMGGEFVVSDSFGMQKGVGGGNFLIIATDQPSALKAARAAVEAMTSLKGSILPFPGGVVRSGSQVGSRYAFLPASTNVAYCPVLKGAVESALPDEANAVLEIVIDGLDRESVEEAMRTGITAACLEGVLQIGAGNYGGSLGDHCIGLYDLFGEGGNQS